MVTRVLHGNIFSSSCQTLVNTVNCVGVMGAGIALEFKFRYPEMYEKYVRMCDDNLIDIGKLWLYQGRDPEKLILNFPTKKHWRNPSKEAYLREGLSNFIDTYEEKGIQSIAFPLLGASHGNIDPERSLSIMVEYLDSCAIPIEIYRFDPRASDESFERFRMKVTSAEIDEMKEGTGLQARAINALRKAITNEQVNSISALVTQKGISEDALFKSYRYLATTRSADTERQVALFPELET